MKIVPGDSLDLLNPPRLDKQSIKKYFNRAAKRYENAAILHEEVENRLLERLQYIRHRPETVVDIGCGTGKGVQGLQKAYPRARVFAADMAFEMLLQAGSRFRLLSKKRLVTADMERLPFASQTFDLVFSSLAMPWCNDVGTTMKEFARISRPGGLLMFSSFGPGTLYELADSWQMMDTHPHVHQFVDMHDVGDAMLADDLRNIGANNADVSRRRGLMTPAQLRKLETCYRQHGFEGDKFVASYEVVYGHAWIDAP
jgi:malonyl-CoA O-methyltransferase